MVRRPILPLLWCMKQLFSDMENHEEKICSCALNRIFGFAPKTGLALITCIGSAAEVFQLKESDLERLLGPYSKYKGLIGRQSLDFAEKELHELERKDIRFIGWNEEHYPELLHDCEDAPIGLYVRSTTPLDKLWKPKRRIAVVGTRDISSYGREWCMKTVNGIAESSEKPTIVSGLALGTDFYAHRTALDCGLPTIGVMATGPEDVYPVRHHEFAERLYRTPGCALVTDYPPGTRPLPVHFLRRNRIIAGLSDSTILIESKAKGGGIMTCNLAFSYNREVYALPGRADDIRSQGCNNLIRRKVAEPLTSVEDLMVSMNLKKAAVSRTESTEDLISRTYGTRMQDGQMEIMNEILRLIKNERDITVDEIAAATGLPYSTAASLTSVLETDGIIRIDLLQRCSLSPTSKGA